MTLEATQFPRLLARLPSSGWMSWEAHQALHGSLPRPRLQGRDLHLIGELEQAGVRGYGGAEFPTATKLHAVGAQGSRPAVVVNATEGEPLSAKDKLLVRRLPHLVLDGALVAAGELRSETVVVAVDETEGATRRAMEDAVAERPETVRRRAPNVSVVGVPSGYLTGQETALVNVLDGRDAIPTTTPPYPFERGLRGRPTLVSNAETFAQVGLVARHGASWWRALGTAEMPGTRLVSVSGAVAEPGVLEVAGGTTIGRLLEASGGVTEPLRAVLVGGYAGTWLGPEQSTLRIDRQALRGQNARLGAGIIFALPQSACAVAEVAAVARWLEYQSAHQCGPCIHGLGAIADALQSLCERGDRGGGYRSIERWCGLVVRRGACALPDGAAQFVATALQVFAPEFDDHARHGACDACYQPRLMPTFAPAVSA
jgi:NADH:ubiquinone oxidoreductase subunit F (NADH-binding)